MQQRRYNGERRVFRRDANNARPARTEAAPAEVKEEKPAEAPAKEENA